MKLIVGLGNIGKEYANTRHNIGFMVADALAEELQAGSWQEKWRADVAVCYRPKVILAKPRTYMNLSGEAIREIANFYKIAPADILVISDDMDIPLGNIRIRKNGGAGGHNGLKSIIANLVSEDFPRMRIGIAHPQQSGRKVITHVLGAFDAQERELIQPAIKSAVQALKLYLQSEDIELVMNRYNTKKEKKPKIPKEIAAEQAITPAELDK